MRLSLTIVLLFCAFGWSIAQELCVEIEDFDSLQLSNHFNALPDTIGLIKQKEISGIAPSIKYPDHFWAIADSGNGAVLYLYSIKDASLKALFILNGVSNTDWEDLTILKDESGKGTLYIPDIGDNKAKRRSYTVYKIQEPDISASSSKINNILVESESIRFSYSNGARDAEAFAIDPIDGVSYVITKREKEVFLYSIPNEKSDTTQLLQPLGKLPITMVVGADFNIDGSIFMLKTYTSIYLWKRLTPNESFCEMISRKPEKVNYQLEPQGESLCFVEDKIITVSEERFGIKPKLYLYHSLFPTQD